MWHGPTATPRWPRFDPPVARPAAAARGPFGNTLVEVA